MNRVQSGVGTSGESALVLRLLERGDREAFEAAQAEAWEPGFVFAHYYESLAGNRFENYPTVLEAISQGRGLPEGHVPSTLLFAFDRSGRIVGRVSIRHELNGFLMNVGGHIGYGVVPSERRKGHATEILRQSLIYVAHELPGLTRVLLTCDDTNVASIRTIEKNGGVLENLYVSPELPVPKRRYWIALGDSKGLGVSRGGSG